MRLIEAARKLAGIECWDGLGGDGYCIVCDRPISGPGGRHDPNCALLALPQIVEALEAAKAHLDAAWQARRRAGHRYLPDDDPTLLALAGAVYGRPTAIVVRQSE